MTAIRDEREETMGKPQRTIKACRYVPDGLHVKIMATLMDNSIIELFRYYPDELTFTDEELIGLTIPQAIALYHRKDEEYLRSQ